MGQKKELEVEILKKKYTQVGIYLSDTTIEYLLNNRLIINGNEPHPLFPISPASLKEGIHYYIESGKWVFTEYYHFLRGHCCKNGCRHCVYGRRLIDNG